MDHTWLRMLIASPSLITLIIHVIYHFPRFLIWNFLLDEVRHSSHVTHSNRVFHSSHISESSEIVNCTNITKAYNISNCKNIASASNINCLTDPNFSSFKHEGKNLDEIIISSMWSHKSTLHQFEFMNMHIFLWICVHSTEMTMTRDFNLMPNEQS